MTQRLAYTTAEFAEMFQIREETVRAMCRKDLIRAIKIGGDKKSSGGIWRIPATEVSRFLGGEK